MEQLDEQRRVAAARAASAAAATPPDTAVAPAPAAIPASTARVAPAASVTDQQQLRQLSTSQQQQQPPPLGHPHYLHQHPPDDPQGISSSQRSLEALRQGREARERLIGTARAGSASLDELLATPTS